MGGKGGRREVIDGRGWWWCDGGMGWVVFCCCKVTVDLTVLVFVCLFVFKNRWLMHSEEEDGACLFL